MPSILRSSAVLLAVSLLVGSARAQESAETWQPPPPTQDEFDWIQLTSLEWLKGELIALYRQEVEFDSDELDKLTLDWEDIKQIRSGRPMEVSLASGETVVGRITLDETTLRVRGDADREYPREEIVSITARGAREIHNWAIDVSIGGNYRRGNTQQVETTGRAELIRRTAKNLVDLGYLASFNETDGRTAANNQRGTGLWNRFVRAHLYVTPVLGEWFRDPFQNIASRWTIGSGIGYELIATPRTSWDVNLGGAYQRTQFDDVAEGRPTASSTPALVGATSYEYELTSWIDYTFDYRLFLVNEASGTYTHHLVTGAEIDITSLIDFDVTVIWDHIQTPQQASDGTFPKKGDLRLVLSLSFEY